MHRPARWILVIKKDFPERHVFPHGSYTSPFEEATAIATPGAILLPNSIIQHAYLESPPPLARGLNSPGSYAEPPWEIPPALPRAAGAGQGRRAETADHELPEQELQE
jgi:hypothetical protein